MDALKDILPKEYNSFIKDTLMAFMRSRIVVHVYCNTCSKT